MARKYFSQRGSGTPTITIPDFAYRFYSILESFIADRYFEKLEMHNLHLGYISNKLRRKLSIAFGAESTNMIPTCDNIRNMSRSSLFDLIEFLSEYVSKSRDAGRYNVMLGHSTPAQRGRRAWSRSVNEYLALLDPPVHLTPSLEIEALSSSEGLRQLVNNHASPSSDTQEKVDHACRLFLKHDATVHDKHSALVDLIGVLEPLRSEMKARIGKRESDKLFDIANSYGIRHRGQTQEELDENYMQWYFYSTLSTIDLMAKLNKQ